MNYMHEIHSNLSGSFIGAQSRFHNWFLLQGWVCQVQLILGSGMNLTGGGEFFMAPEGVGRYIGVCPATLKRVSPWFMQPIMP